MRHRHGVKAEGRHPGAPRAARLRERWREFASPEFVEVVPLEDDTPGPTPRRLQLLSAEDGPLDPGP
jgi:hypothetical protein